MKKILFSTLVFLMTIIPTIGCVSTNNDNSPMTIEQKVEEIEFFSKTAVKIALHEFNPSVEDTQVLKGYLIAANDLLDETGPDLDGLRQLLVDNLPERYHTIALTIVDVIDRYIVTNLDDPDNDVKSRNALISAGLNGALLSLEEFIEEKESQNV